MEAAAPRTHATASATNPIPLQPRPPGPEPRSGRTFPIMRVNTTTTSAVPGGGGASPGRWHSYRSSTTISRPSPRNSTIHRSVASESNLTAPDILRPSPDNLCIRHTSQNGVPGRPSTGDVRNPEEIQQVLDALPPGEKNSITTAWSLFSQASHPTRGLILNGLLSTHCCSEQVALVRDELMTLTSSSPSSSPSSSSLSSPLDTNSTSTTRGTSVASSSPSSYSSPMTTRNPLIMVEPSIMIPKTPTDPFAVLPREVAIHILSYFDAKELCSGPVRVSRAWKSLADDDVLWKQLYRRSFGQLGLRDAGMVRGGEAESGRGRVRERERDERMGSSLRLSERSQRNSTGEVEEVVDNVEPIDDPDDRSFLTFRPSTNALVPLRTTTVASFPLYQQPHVSKNALRRRFPTERNRERGRGANSGFGYRFIANISEKSKFGDSEVFRSILDPCMAQSLIRRHKLRRRMSP